MISPDVPVTKTISDQTQEAAESLGFTTVYADRFPAAGNVSYTSYVAAMQDKGVRGLPYTGEPEALAAIEQTMQDQNYHPDWIASLANLYDQHLVDIGAPPSGTPTSSRPSPRSSRRSRTRPRSSTSTSSSSTSRTGRPRRCSVRKGARRGSCSRRRRSSVVPTSPGAACTTT
ncbi:MAG: hypothetical protein ACXVLO_19090 [Acidimicrobiia bacterium]